MTTPEPNNEHSPAPPSLRRIIGLVLITTGILWMAASGLCSAAFLVTIFTEGPGSAGEILSILPMIALVGGFSVGVGFVLYVVGRALRPET